MEWIMDNLATIIVGLLLLTAVIFAIYRLIKEHRNGKCSGGCPGCSLAGKCPHSKQLCLIQKAGISRGMPAFSRRMRGDHLYKKAHNGSNPMSKMSNESREDYLEAIYLLTEQTCGAVRSVRLAEFMGLSKASICKVVAGLKEDGCISMDTDYLIALTATGMDEAKRIYRKHRYFERQLVAAGVDSETASAEACRLEHAISDNSFEKLIQLYGQWTTDESEVMEG